MREYDFIFSLGFSCGTSQALRAAGLQFASYPLDWVGSPGVVASARLVERKFVGWFEAEDLELVDVRHSAGFCTRIYRNRKTGVGYSHEFSDFDPFGKTYPKVRGSYEHRAEHFERTFRSSKRILAIFMELPIRGRAPDADLLEARRILRASHPDAEIDLMYVYAEPGVAVPRFGEEIDGILTAAYDYRKFDRGEVTHFIDFGPLAEFLRKNFRARDTRTAAEKTAFVQQNRMIADLRWGPDKSRFRRWLNKHAYKLFRSLERRLTERGLVHREGPLWFVEK